MRATLLAAILSLALATDAQAIEVKISGLHLCCGGCVSGVEDALVEVEGVSKPTIDRKAGTAVFVVEKTETATKALESVGQAGFHGTATADGKEIEFPNTKVAAGTTAKKATFKGVHLCCRACSKGAEKSLAKIDGIGPVTCSQDAGTIVVEGAAGAELDLVKVQEALNKSGFHALLDDEKSEAKK